MNDEKPNKKTRRNDALLILLLALAALGLLIVHLNQPRAPAAQVEIHVDGALQAAFPFGEARSWTWAENGEFVEVRSDESGVRIAASSCPDQLCVRQGTIAQSGRGIICLPNRVSIQLTSNAQPELDAMLY